MTQATAESVFQLIEDNRFLGIADEYLPLQNGAEGTSYREYLQNKMQHMNDTECLVPILGIQGTGKSSLLNALLMDDLVLPVDADETTCIPVEIRYGENDGAIHVYHGDSGKVEVLNDPELLERYTHNRFNPGNEKNISHIVIFKRNELLENGLVLVDLPGVGSLTQKNVETTLRYIEKLAAAVFMLRTVPPITRSEKLFLTHVWPKLTSAWFVQNQWNDETMEEVEDGKTHNLRILRDISALHKMNPVDDIRVINVYRALCARLTGDAAGYQKSGMDSFRSDIKALSNTWKDQLLQDFVSSFRLLVQNLKRSVTERAEDLSLNQAELQQKYDLQEQEYGLIIEENRRKIRDIEELVWTRKGEFTQEAEGLCRIHTENFRSEMRRVVGGGVVDGQLLNRAFQDTQKTIIQNVMEELSMRAFEIQREINVHLEDLEVKDIKGESITVGEFQKDRAFKYEKGIPFAASAIAVAASLALSNPITAVLAGLALWWLGSKAKKAVAEERKKATLTELEEQVRAFGKQLKASIMDYVNQAFRHVEEELERFKTNQLRDFEAERVRHREVLRGFRENLEKTRNAVAEDLAYIISVEEGLHV